jgi:hypothetical protein
LVHVLGCHQHWLDLRHLKTLAWMVSGLILSSQISLGGWALYIHSRALYMASSIRRIRIKESFWIYRGSQPRQKACDLRVGKGYAKFWHEVQITKAQFGPLHLAVGRPLGSTERWLVISDEPTCLETFREYALRFDIEENFLEDKSNGFQLEASLIRSAPALERLCLVLAVATLYLVSQGTQVVETGKRRWIDAHWFRGHSYLKIGWNWVRRALSRKEKIITYLALSTQPDPQPAKASQKQHEKRTQPRFYIELRKAA